MVEQIANSPSTLSGRIYNTVEAWVRVKNESSETRTFLVGAEFISYTPSPSKIPLDTSYFKEVTLAPGQETEVKVSEFTAVVTGTFDIYIELKDKVTDSRLDYKIRQKVIYCWK